MEAEMRADDTVCEVYITQYGQKFHVNTCCDAIIQRLTTTYEACKFCANGIDRTGDDDEGG
eukprot:6266208-Prorocentrum_lima.AAC.1